MKITRRPGLLALLAILATLPLVAGCQNETGASPDRDDAARPAVTKPESPHTTATHRFTEVAPDVWFAVGTGSIFVQSNALVIVNENDVVVVDSHVTPAAARALLDSIETITEKPVRYLINSHYHFDHAHGNQAFPEGVAIVGHRYTRQKLLGAVLDEPTYKTFTGGIPGAVEAMKAQLDGLEGSERSELEDMIRVQEAHLEALSETRPTPPDVTISEHLTIHRGHRNIELHFLGRGHTGGDIVVYLPQDEMVFTGDLLLPFPSYMGTGWVNEWPETLDRVLALDAETFLPGHGEPFSDRAPVEAFQALLRELWSQAENLHGQGLSAKEAAEQIDLEEQFSAWKVNPLGSLPPEQVLQIMTVQVARIYELLENDGEDPHDPVG